MKGGGEAKIRCHCDLSKGGWKLPSYDWSIDTHGDSVQPGGAEQCSCKKKRKEKKVVWENVK